MRGAARTLASAHDVVSVSVELESGSGLTRAQVPAHASPVHPGRARSSGADVGFELLGAAGGDKW